MVSELDEAVISRAIMGANAVYGSPRMGPVFGGMLLSGKKAAEEIIVRLKEEG
jgi:thiamine thiazole synthase